MLTIINFAFPNLFALLSKLKKSVRKIQGEKIVAVYNITRS